MSTDTAVPAWLFYKLEEAPDQLPEQYPSSPQKTQLQEFKREKNVPYRSTHKLSPILLPCLVGHSLSSTKTNACTILNFCVISMSLTSTNNFRINNRFLLGLKWTGEHAGSHLMYTECPRRNGQNFGRVFLMLNYTDITQNTYIQS